MNEVTKYNDVKSFLNQFVDRRSAWFQYLYHFYWKKASFPSIGHLINAYSKTKKEVFFAQIGANEGSTEDPLYPHIRLKNWKGLLIEPYEEAFRKLKLNFPGNKGLIFEQAALSSTESTANFYYIVRKDPSVPEWVSKLNSFDRSITNGVVEKFGDKVEIKSKEILCTTLSQLTQRHEIDQIDLIFIDTEGHDYEILKSIDLDFLKTELVIFEHRHLKKGDHRAAVELLIDNGYDVFIDEFDTAGFKVDALKNAYLEHLEK